MQKACSTLLGWLDLSRWTNLAPWKSDILCHISFRWNSLLSAWLCRCADSVFLCHLVALLVILWHVLRDSPKQVAVYENAECLISYAMNTSVTVTFPSLEQKSLHFLSQACWYEREQEMKIDFLLKASHQLQLLLWLPVACRLQLLLWEGRPKAWAAHQGSPIQMVPFVPT